MTTLDYAIDQLKRVRRYTLQILETIPEDKWFWQPQEGVTHVAWQVGHLAVAQYSLAIRRIHGEQPGDEKLMTAEFRAHFGKGSVPNADSTQYPSIDEIRAVFDEVQAQALARLADIPPARVDEPSQPEHPMFDTKLGALLWCAEHEFTHAGQISLLRRLQGSQPIW